MKKCVKGVEVYDKQDLNNPYDILEDLINKGYTKIQFVVGADRAKQFNSLQDYATEWSDGKATVDVITFADERVGDYSATKMRELAINDNFTEFYKDCPDGLSEKDSKEMFEKVKEGLKT